MRRSLIIAVLAAAAPASLAYFAAYRPALERAHERVAHGSEVVSTPCGPIEYASAGEGPAVLVVHGAGGGFDQGAQFGAPLAARGHRVVAMSRFGYLRTPLPEDASAAAQADAHACLLDALGISRVAIIGASAGAPSSLQFALRHSDRVTALVLVVPAAYTPRAEGEASLRTPRGTRTLFETALRFDFLFWAATRLARDTVTRALLATPPDIVASASAEEQRRVADLLHHILPISPRRLGLVNDAIVTSSLERYALERIAVPTLAVSAADDLFGTYDAARYAAEQIPGARFVGYANGGHVWVGHHAELVEEIHMFLRGVQN